MVEQVIEFRPKLDVVLLFNFVFLISDQSKLIRLGSRRSGWESESVGSVNAGAVANAVVSNQ